ncbi:MAG TPA: FAD-linked oxidase C-terminal domain-containing protein [Gemmatimonadaceae bacterium]|nr:FAD-linked oxidase C-terminal domain-containing protein [Gemmatimonadaceae bacterium]
MTSELEQALRKALHGDVRFDEYTRNIYSTDASLYTIEPLGVAYPRDADDVVAAMEVATRFGVPVLPRGAGTSLAGQTVSEAVVLDMSRSMHRLLSLDAETLAARVQPGLIQDDLNKAAAKHRLMFAPDTSTSNRATLGGMIGNNSCGARSARYGMTIDHVDSLDVVLSDGSRTTLRALNASELATRSKGSSLDARLHRDVQQLVARHETSIRRDFPPFWRKSGGYRLERMLPERGPFNLANLVIGSEGTLAIVVEASVRLVPQPKAVVGVAGHFETVAAAIEAAEVARECDAAVIELVDRFILNLARRSQAHGKLVSVLEGDPGGLLWLEFYGDTPEEARAAAEQLERKWQADKHGYAVLRAETADQLTRFRELRKAGLGLLSAAGERGERSVAFIEDTAVDPTRLGEYTARLATLLGRHRLTAGFYGHASAGCLHIRPFMDLTRPGAVATLRAVADEVCALVTEFGGNNSSEHGDGLVRSEFNRQIFGEELYGAMQSVKQLFDPHGRLNPGKKVDAPRMTEHLREPALPRALPVATHFSFDATGGMRGAANRCARIGACRKSDQAGRTMCPSFMATRDERHSTRGRANALVHALSSADPQAALGDDGLHEALDLCLECKACKTECPLSVDMATLKSETLAHYYRRHGTPLRARMFGHVRTLNKVGAALAPVSNWVAGAKPVRVLAERFGGIDRRRSLPRFQRETLTEWFERRSPLAPLPSAKRRGPVVFLADSFTSFTEPEIGKAAVELLEMAGWNVELASDVCCGRALISKGLLAEARETQGQLMARLGAPAAEGTPIVGCEPSCVFTMKDELPDLSRGDARASAMARQARMVDDLIAEAIDDGSLPLDPTAAVAGRRILFHGHCHQKAAGATGGSIALLQRIPGATVDVLDAGCCGMAGSFGFEREHFDLSMQIGGMRLFPAVSAAPDAIVAATGVSCRQQIAQGTSRQAVHPIVLVRQVCRPETTAPTT